MKKLKHLFLLLLTLSLVGCEPIVAITSPTDGERFYVKGGVLFTGTARAILEGQLPEDVCVWRSDRDGEIGAGTEFITYDLSTGTHIITLTATNSWGEEGSASGTIHIIPQELFPIDATIHSPTDGTVYKVGESIVFEGTATDSYGEELTGDSLIWTSDTDGEIDTGTTFTRNDLSAGVHTITLTASDSFGFPDTDSVSITIGKGGEGEHLDV